MLTHTSRVLLRVIANGNSLWKCNRCISHLESKDRFGGIIYDLTRQTQDDKFHDHFQKLFLSKLKQLIKSHEAPAVWVQVPARWSSLLPFLLQTCGLRYHHAEGEKAMLVRWLAKGEDKTPIFGTHQVGITALVTNDDEKTILMVQEKSNRYAGWKPPTGVAGLGEDIGDAAVREVKEETGLECQFHSVLAFRQQHNAFNAFGRSDLLFVCRLSPISQCLSLTPCPTEINACEWLTPNQVKQRHLNLFQRALPTYLQRLLDLAELGFSDGWNSVEHIPERMSTVMDVNKTFYLYYATKTNV